MPSLPEEHPRNLLLASFRKKEPATGVALAATEDEEVLVLLVLVDWTELEVVVVPHWVPKKKQFHQL